MWGSVQIVVMCHKLLRAPPASACNLMGQMGAVRLSSFLQASFFVPESALLVNNVIYISAKHDLNKVR